MKTSKITNLNFRAKNKHIQIFSSKWHKNCKNSHIDPNSIEGQESESYQYEYTQCAPTVTLAKSLERLKETH